MPPSTERDDVEDDGLGAGTFSLLSVVMLLLRYVLLNWAGITLVVSGNLDAVDSIV